jgi:hypothetical protein
MLLLSILFQMTQFTYALNCKDNQYEITVSGINGSICAMNDWNFGRFEPCFPSDMELLIEYYAELLFVIMCEKTALSTNVQVAKILLKI